MEDAFSSEEVSERQAKLRHRLIWNFAEFQSYMRISLGIGDCSFVGGVASSANLSLLDRVFGRSLVQWFW